MACWSRGAVASSPARREETAPLTTGCVNFITLSARERLSLSLPVCVCVVGVCARRLRTSLPTPFG
eukprot:scaffold232357_cov19-Tisochrysis_lutea.AAC.1